jgi:lipopolysaccharide export system permease protein
MTVALYVSRQVALRILAVLLSLSALALGLDMLENSTEIIDQYGMDRLGAYALFRLPLILVAILPIGTLLGSAMAFLTLALRSEMTVLRGFGVNTLRVLLMLAPLALAIGVAQNLLTSWAGPAAERVLAERFPQVAEGPGLDRELWLRDWRAVIRIGRATPGASTLADVSIFELDDLGRLSQRIDAATARYGRDGWRLGSVTRVSASLQPERLPELLWDSRLTPAGILAVARRSELVDAGDVRDILAGAVPGGRGTPFYAVQLWRGYAAFLVPPVMFLFGALASFGLIRSGGGTRHVALGLVGGTVFILVDGVFGSLGEVGAMGPALAAFVAPVLFLLIGLWSVVVVEE